MPDRDGEEGFFPAPRLADAFLEWYCAPEYLDEVQGDLQELHQSRQQAFGRRAAQLLYCIDVIRFFRPYLLKRKLFSLAGGPMMFQNYLKIAFRNLIKHKGYSFINISGLVTGLTACILILLYVQDELSYDRFHRDADRIYRVTSVETKDGNTRHFAYTYGPLAPILLNDFPEIEQAVRVFPNSVVISLDTDKRFQENVLFVDSTFFDVFSFSLKRGNRQTALQSPYAIVLTQKAASKYFGNDNPLGRVLNVENGYDFKVTGVLNDLPANSHFHFEFLASIGSIRDIQDWALTSWYWPPMYTYVKLPAGYQTQSLEARFPDLVAKNIGNWARDQRLLRLHPLTDIRLHSNLEGEIAPTGNIIYVVVFSTIAAFILLIACINFMNLATARSANRAREVGLRKVVGARRGQLINQFFGESIFYAVFSLLLALLVVEFLLPYFNALIGKELSVNYSSNWRILLAFLSLSVVVGLLSGSYPALFLSKFRPVRVLSGGGTGGGKGGWHARLRSLLVVLQFAISIALIISASVIKEQLDYLKNKNLGFGKDQIVIIPVRDELIQNNWSTIKGVLQGHSDIVGVTATSTIPGIERDIDFPIKTEGESDEFTWNMETMLVDHDFIKTFAMVILSGRDFSRAFSTDTSDAFILNEAAVTKLGWDKTSALGKKLGMHAVDSGQDKLGKVIGVVKDFHFRSLHHRVDPLALQISPQPYYFDNLAVKVSGGNISGALAFLEAKWQEIVPNRPFEFQFLNEVFEQTYRKEQRLSELFGYFSGLAIFIGCLGLFGLASFTAEQRTKEIGIRKVLGASAANIVVMFSRELFLLIGIAFVIASPLAYYSMNQWLQGFAYKTDISILTFGSAGMLAFFIALLTISFQALKAALANPVNSLRYQ